MFDEFSLKICETDPSSSTVQHWIAGTPAIAGRYGLGPIGGAITRGPIMYPLLYFQENQTPYGVTTNVGTVMYLKRLTLQYVLRPTNLNSSAYSSLLNRVMIIYDRGFNNPAYMTTSPPGAVAPFNAGAYLYWLQAILGQNQQTDTSDQLDYPTLTTLPNFKESNRFVILYDDTFVLPPLAPNGGPPIGGLSVPIGGGTMAYTPSYYDNGIRPGLHELAKLIEIDLEGFETRGSPTEDDGSIQGQLYFFCWNSDPVQPGTGTDVGWQCQMNARVYYADLHNDARKKYQ